MDNIEKYLTQLKGLHTAKMGGRQAPHKAVLLLAIMELVEKGVITTERIELTEDLSITFLDIWYENIGRNPLYKPNIDKPFWHLKNEPFYNLYMKDGSDLRQFGNPYSVRKLREMTYAVLDKELFELLKHNDTRRIIRTVLYDTYLQGWNTQNSPATLYSLIIANMLIRLVA